MILVYKLPFQSVTLGLGVGLGIKAKICGLDLDLEAQVLGVGLGLGLVRCGLVNITVCIYGFHLNGTLL